MSKQLSIITVIAMIVLLGSTAMAATFNDAADGDWTTPGTWTAGSGYPQSGDNVIKDDAIQVDVTSNQEFGDAANASTFSAGTINIATGNTLTHLAGSTLNNTAAITWAGAGTFANAGTFASSGGSTVNVDLSAAGFTFANTGTVDKGNANYRGMKFVGATGGGVFTSTGGSITNTGGGTMLFDNASDGPAWSISNTGINAGSGKIEFAGLWSSIGGVAGGADAVTFQSNAGNSINDVYADSTLGLTLNVTGYGLQLGLYDWRTSTIDANSATVTNDGLIKVFQQPNGSGFLVHSGTFVNNGELSSEDAKLSFGKQSGGTLIATNGSAGTLNLSNTSGSARQLMYIGNTSDFTNAGTLVKQGADQAAIKSESWGKGDFINNGTIRVEEGTLYLDNLTLTFNSAGSFEFQLEDLATYDENLLIGENASLAGTITAIDNGMNTGVWYTVITMDSGLSLTDAGLTAGTDTMINVVEGADGYVQVQLVPEPATLGLLAMGSLALLRRRRS